MKIKLRDSYVAIILIISIQLLTSCSKANRMRRFDNDDKQADRQFELLLETIRNKDTDGLKNLFTKQVISESSNLNTGIDYVFEQFLESEITWKREKYQVSREINHGTRIKEIKAWYDVQADNQKYIVFMLFYPEWTKEPEKEGLYALRVVKEEDRKTQMTFWEDMKIPGIYQP